MVPKIKSFLWKVLVGTLPIGILLIQQGIGIDASCKRCGALESITHVLRDCLFFIKVWSFPIFGIGFEPRRYLLFYLWFEKFKIANHVDIKVAVLYSWIYYGTYG